MEWDVGRGWSRPIIRPKHFRHCKSMSGLMEGRSIVLLHMNEIICGVTYVGESCARMWTEREWKWKWVSGRQINCVHNTD